MPTVNCQLRTANQQFKKQAAGNYSSPATEDIGQTKICSSNKESGR